MAIKAPPKWWPALGDKVDINAKIPPEADQNFRLLFNGLNDHGDALGELKKQIDAIVSGDTPVPIPTPTPVPGGGGIVIPASVPICEVPVGVIDGVNLAFSSTGLPNPISTFIVSLNGVDQFSNLSGGVAPFDVVIATDGTFTFTVAPYVPDWIVIRYTQ